MRRWKRSLEKEERGERGRRDGEDKDEETRKGGREMKEEEGEGGEDDEERGGEEEDTMAAAKESRKSCIECPSAASPARRVTPIVVCKRIRDTFSTASKLLWRKGGKVMMLKGGKRGGRERVA